MEEQILAWTNLGQCHLRSDRTKDQMADTYLDGLEEWQVWTDTGLERLSDSRDGGVEEQILAWTNLGQIHLRSDSRTAGTEEWRRCRLVRSWSWTEERRVGLGWTCSWTQEWKIRLQKGCS